MNVTQMARNQQMMYKFINRSGGSAYQAQMQSQMSSLSSRGSSSNDDVLSNMLQNMGISGLQGGTAREMAQYQMRVQEAQKSASTQQIYSSRLGDAPQTQQFSARQQYAPISDKAAEAMQQLALEDAKNSIGSKTGPDATERANLIRDQLKDVDPSQRTASFNTMNKVWESEMDRLGNYIREKDSNWQDWGDEFDTSILDDYKPGVNVWV